MSPSDPPPGAQEDGSPSATAPASHSASNPASTPASHSAPNPPGDRAEEERRSANWDGIAAMPAFQALLHRKKVFIVSGTLFFLLYYFALPILVGYLPEAMEQKVGPVNVAYLFALSQFVMAWVVAAVYVKVAAGWDRAAEEIIKQAGGK